MTKRFTMSRFSERFFFPFLFTFTVYELVYFCIAVEIFLGPVSLLGVLFLGCSTCSGQWDAAPGCSPLNAPLVWTSGGKLVGKGSGWEPSGDNQVQVQLVSTGSQSAQVRSADHTSGGGPVERGAGVAPPSKINPECPSQTPSRSR